MRRYVFSFFLVLFSLFAASQDNGQLPIPDSLANTQNIPSLADSIITAQESLGVSPLPADSIPAVLGPRPGGIETTINYNARDSIFFDVTRQNITMYGETHIDYGEISLDAEKTDVNWRNKTLKSIYVEDSTGKRIGKPVFTQQQDVYVTENILYDFDTKRATIKGVVTEQDGAFMHGDNVKKNERDELFIRGARYTTCNLAHPHFFIESTKLKAIPGNKILSGPFVLKFRSTEKKSIFTPLALPFGWFPQPKSRVSGVIFPSYGEERRRGFFLREGGYYWAISDYIDLRVTGDIFSRGGAGLRIASRYKKRYAYSGSLSYRFNRTITEGTESEAIRNDTWIQWSHTPETRGNSSFSASVSFGTSSFNQNNNLVNQDFERSINSQFTSSVSYQRRFRGASLSVNARQNQNISTGITNFTFPELSFNLNRINPLEKIIKDSNSPLSKLNFSYNFVSQSQFTNAPSGSLGGGINVVNQSENSSDTLNFFGEFDRVLERGRFGGRHTIPISTSLSVLKHFTLTPSFNYQELWYPGELQFEFDEALNGVRVDTVRRFSRASSWQSSASLNTVIYGTYFVNGKRIKAIRHVITPSVAFSYNPDFGDPQRGVFQDIQVDSTGRTQRFSRYQGFVFGSPPSGESQIVSFGVTNNLEMKVRNKRDSVGEEFKKVKIFDNLSLRTGYNFAAEEFNLSPITFSARTSFLQNALSVNVNGTIDPYIYELRGETVSINGVRTVDQERVNRLSIDAGQGLGQLSSLTTNISLSLSPSTFARESASTNNETTPSAQNTSFFDDPSIAPAFADPDELAQIQNNPDEYIDFNLPWRFSANYSISRRKTGFADATITQSLAFNGSLSLTPKTQVSFNSGYDLERNEFTTTRVSISRDLHCWTLSFNVVPFGRFQSFNLVIQPRSSLLQELKLERRRNFRDSF